jgi:hypothetical protein
MKVRRGITYHGCLSAAGQGNAYNPYSPLSAFQRVNLLGRPMSCRKPSLRGGLSCLWPSSGLCADRKKEHAAYGIGLRVTVTPKWELRRNRKFPGGNVRGMSGLQLQGAKTRVFPGCCGESEGQHTLWSHPSDVGSASE